MRGLFFCICYTKVFVLKNPSLASLNGFSKNGFAFLKSEAYFYRKHVRIPFV